jgi:long-chain acyl-CoA synthetase
MFWRLLKLPEAVRRRYDTSSLRFVAVGAAACPPDVKTAMIEWWGPIIYEFYGATETGPVTFATPQDALEKPGTVGRVIDGAVIVAKDREGNNVPSGTVGELYMRQTYWPEFDYHNNADARTRIERDGLVTAGDLGFIDADGHVFIVDRVKDMIVSGGANIYPAEIEAALVSHPAIADAAVIGVPDPEYGEIPVAFIEPRPDARCDVEEVKAWLASRIARNKMPRRYEFHTSLPREDSGKIFKNRLREEIRSRATQAA